MDRIIKRNEKLAFYKVGNTFYRMRGFTDFAISKNPNEYSRKYVDEETERNDIVGYNPQISFSFDRFSQDTVHTDMVNIADKELLGGDAVRQIMIVNLTEEDDDGCVASVREFSVIPDSEGSDADTYTYSGTLKANGALVFGIASTTDGWKTASFEADADEDEGENDEDE